jgi:hypothetical protein
MPGDNPAGQSDTLQAPACVGRPSETIAQRSCAPTHREPAPPPVGARLRRAITPPAIGHVAEFPLRRATIRDNRAAQLRSYTPRTCATPWSPATPGDNPAGQSDTLQAPACAGRSAETIAQHSCAPTHREPAPPPVGARLRRAITPPAIGHVAEFPLRRATIRDNRAAQLRSYTPRTCATPWSPATPGDNPAGQSDTLQAPACAGRPSETIAQHSCAPTQGFSVAGAEKSRMDLSSASQGESGPCVVDPRRDSLPRAGKRRTDRRLCSGHPRQVARRNVEFQLPGAGRGSYFQQSSPA